MAKGLEDALSQVTTKVVQYPQVALVDRVTTRANNAIGTTLIPTGSGLDCKSGMKPISNVLEFVPKVEEIMQARGLNVGARFQRRWRTGKPNRLAGKQSDGMGSARPLAIENVSMDWVLGFERAKEMFEELQRTDVVFSSKGKTVLRKKINELFAKASEGQLQVQFGEFPEGIAREAQYINHISIDEYSAYSAGIDDLNAALGRFSMFVIPEGVATWGEDGRMFVKVKDLGIYIRDSFDFEGEQALGRWKLPDKAELTEDRSDPSYEKQGSMKMICPDEWVYMSNWIFRMYRTESGQFGEDFLVYSDIKVVPLDPPFVFEYPPPRS